MTDILFVGGASIGHIAPSVAVAEALHTLVPNAQPYFLCSPSALETDYIRKNGYPYSTLNSPGISVSFPWKFMRACKQADRMLRELRPKVIFSKGGHISIPVCLAAKWRGIPIVLHESDSVSGRANRLVGMWATIICTGFPLRGKNKYVHTGNPVRNTITGGSKKEGLRLTGLSGNRPVLLVTGGSQGAQALNEAVASHIHELLELCDIVHITGNSKTGAVVQDARYFCFAFAYEELPHFYAMADLALSRAGAGTLAELAANGLPTIIVPLRHVGHDHQQKNAEKAIQTGGCILLDQSSLNNKLVETVNTCLSNQDLLHSMSERIRAVSSGEASLQIAKILSEFLASPALSH